MHTDTPSATLAHPHAHHAPPQAELNERLAAARPRLLCVARHQGLSPEASEEVVQETLLDAWRTIESLREPERFDGWLAGICRRHCLMRLRHDGAARRGGHLARVPLGDAAEQELANGLGGPSLDDFDPVAELERQDLHTLLDRALAHLSASAREALTLCYLDELPQAEAALRLGLTVAALEARLHRARKQLRAVLAGTLRAEAAAFDLPLGDDSIAGWRESRLWCVACGRHRLRGIFEPLPGGVNLRMRCPGCTFQINSGGVPLGNLRSFRPAVNRLLRIAVPYVTQGLREGWQRCPQCGTPRQIEIKSPFELSGMDRPWPGLTIYLRCQPCDANVNTSLAIALWQHPAVERFTRRYPRCVSEPERLVEYAGRPAIRVAFASVADGRRLTLIADRATLEILAAQDT